MGSTGNKLTIKKGHLKFYVGDDEVNALAKITFVYKEDNIVIEHTLVNEVLKGQGVARTLVEQVVELAHQENKKIVPTCDYAKKVLTQEMQYRDILADEVIMNCTNHAKEAQK